MNQLKLYAQATFGELIIGWVILSDVNDIVKLVAGIFGIVVACFTIYKLKLDIQLRIHEKEIKSMEIKFKRFELEERIKKSYE